MLQWLNSVIATEMYGPQSQKYGVSGPFWKKIAKLWTSHDWLMKERLSIRTFEEKQGQEAAVPYEFMLIIMCQAPYVFSPSP